jgi:hypothetical protein
MKEFKAALKRFLPKLREAKEKNLNEADTRMRIHLLISEILGYDMLNEITKEHMVQSHYVDLTVKLKDKIIFFVEVKSVDTTLRETHAYQTINYAATGGVNLCLLTNGIDYRLYYLTWDKAKVESTVIASFNVLEDDINEVAEKLFLLSKESFRKNIIEKYIAERTSLEDKNLLQALLSKRVLTAIRLELKHLTGHNIKDEAIERCIANLYNNEIYEAAKACLKRKERREKKSGEPAETVKESCAGLPMIRETSVDAEQKKTP